MGEGGGGGGGGGNAANWLGLGRSLLDGNYRDPNTIDAGVAFIPYLGWANTASKVVGGPTIGKYAGKIMGGGGSRTNAIARQYQAVVDKWDKEYFQPTMESITDVKRNVPGSTRIGNRSFRDAFTDLEGARAGLDDMIGSGNFGGITGRMKEIGDVINDISKKFGRGGGPGIRTNAEMGGQNLRLPDMKTGLGQSEFNQPNVYGQPNPIQSEGNRFAVKTTRTPNSKSLTNMLQGYNSPGIL